MGWNQAGSLYVRIVPEGLGGGDGYNLAQGLRNTRCSVNSKYFGFEPLAEIWTYFSGLEDVAVSLPDWQDVYLQDARHLLLDADFVAGVGDFEIDFGPPEETQDNQVDWDGWLGDYCNAFGLLPIQWGTSWTEGPFGGLSSLTGASIVTSDYAGLVVNTAIAFSKRNFDGFACLWSFPDGQLADEIQMLSARYHNPSVVKLPDGAGFLMLLERRRWATSNSTELTDLSASARDIDSVRESPNNCLSDIVCYHSSTPFFNDASNTTGPYWLLPGFLRTVSRGNSEAYSPVWLSIPGAVVRGDCLFVYFVAERSRYWSNLADAVISESDLRAAEDDIDFMPGIHVVKFELSTLLQWIGYNWENQRNEQVWEQLGVEPGIYEVAYGATPLGPIRVWMGEQLMTRSLSSDSADDVVFKYTRLVDPAPGCRIDDDGGMSFPLFFAVLGANSGDWDHGGFIENGAGYGVWCAVTESAIAHFRSAWEWGVDFRVRVADSSGEYADKVVDTLVSSADPRFSGEVSGSDHFTNEVSKQYTDPDPVQLDDGSWVVFVSTNISYNVGYPPAQYPHGTEASAYPYNSALATAENIAAPIEVYVASDIGLTEGFNPFTAPGPLGKRASRARSTTP